LSRLSKPSAIASLSLFKPEKKRGASADNERMILPTKQYFKPQLWQQVKLWSENYQDNEAEQYGVHKKLLNVTHEIAFKTAQC